MSQSCINCGGSKVETHEGDIFSGHFVHRDCKGCGFTWRMKDNNVPDKWEPYGVGNTTYAFTIEGMSVVKIKESLVKGNWHIRVVPCGALLVGDEQEIGELCS